MDFISRIQRLWDRVWESYPLWEIALELAIIWLVVYAVVKFVQGTRAAGALKALLLMIVVSTLVVRIVGQRDVLERITFLYSEFMTLLAITLIVIFQPELRRGLIRLGETPILRRMQAAGEAGAIEGIVEACGFLSKARFGAIIAMERDVPIRAVAEGGGGGTLIDARVSAALLQTIFFPGSTLHDLAVVVRGDRVMMAGVQLPLADPEDMPDETLGSRHRAAVGLSKECDALVVVVSEETGRISVAERGKLARFSSADQLRDHLRDRLGSTMTRAAVPLDDNGVMGEDELDLMLDDSALAKTERSKEGETIA